MNARRCDVPAQIPEPVVALATMAVGIGAIDPSRDTRSSGFLEGLFSGQQQGRIFPRIIFLVKGANLFLGPYPFGSHSADD
ncbi:MAG TPA: hypothetical protein VEE84_09880 [Burkholderiaceae bacterium]|nr:hypothetical protein [Burkholderiaceae bacterium]